MNQIVTKIKSRGYYRISIRPFDYNAARVRNILSLQKIIRESAVQLRGWDFPHVDSRSDVSIGDTYIEHETDWEHYVEYWRFYQSGQFVFFGGIWNDWLDQSHLWERPRNWGDVPRLGVGDTTMTLVEIFEFASRLAASEAGTPLMVIDVRLSGLNNRLLWLDDPNRVPFSRDYRASIPEWTYSTEMSLADLVGDQLDTPLRIAQELFRRFGWDADIDLLRSIVERFKL